MAETWKPTTADQAREIVHWAAAEGVPLEVVGGGTKRGFGRPVQVDGTLDVSGLAGIRVYEPEELVLSAEPGTPIAEIEAALAGHGQMLAFDPPDLGPLLGEPAGRGTLGGIVATNLSGPRRIRAGAVRDHILGVEGISGRGDGFKAGGRVMKNVTGYDIPKLMTGSLGTLAVLTHVTVKVLPLPAETRTVVLSGLDDAAAIAALSEALQSPYEITGAAHLPAPVAARMEAQGLGGGTAATLLRVDGFPASVEFRCQWLTAQFAGRGDPRVIDGDAGARLWSQVRDVGPFAAQGDDRHVWRLSVAPGEAAGVARRIAAALDADYFFDWGGGLIWLAVPPADDGSAAVIRGAIDGIGGQATLVRAPAPVRSAVAVFQPMPGPLSALTARVKDSFDPRRILNPGRLQADI